MNPPGGTSTVAGGICTICPHGRIEVIVWKHAICWDTQEIGYPNAKDPPFEDVTVRLNEVVQNGTQQQDGTIVVQYSTLAEQDTGSDGKVTFSNLIPATYTVTAARHVDYEEVTSELESALSGNMPSENQPSVTSNTQVQLRNEAQVEVGKTSYVDLVLRKKAARTNPDGSWTQGRECTRRHGPKVTPVPKPSSLGSLFWSDEPALLVFRDVLWSIILPLGIVICVLVGVLAQSMAGLDTGALIAALWAYIGAIIFGIGFGIPACVIAAALFVALLVVNIVLGAIHSSMSPDPFVIGFLAGVWAAFGVGYLGGRRDEWRSDRFFWPFPAAPFWPLVLIGAVAALLVGLLVAGVSNQLSVAVPIVTFLGGSIFGGLGGWAGYAFANEGQTQGPFVDTDFHLPYEAERYCLQGPRGFWSHFNVEDGGNDFSVPPGTSALCAKEGHVVSLYDKTHAAPLVHATTNPPQQCFDELTRGSSNHAEVRHKDGSVAKYVYMKTGGITGTGSDSLPHWGRPVEQAVPEGSAAWLDPAAPPQPNPLHIQTGHQLGVSGWPCFEPLTLDTPSGPVWWPFLLGVGWAVLWLGLFFLLTFTVFKGAPPQQVGFPFGADNCYQYVPSAPSGQQYTDTCYCEYLTGHDVEQISNTYSDLLFPVLGLIQLAIFCFSGPSFQPFKNRITDRVEYSLIYGFIIIFMGPGSMFFHGWFVSLPGIFDGASMYFLAGFLCAYNLVRMFDWSFGIFNLIFWATILIAFAFDIAFSANNGVPDPADVMFVFVGVALVIQFLTVLDCRIRTDPKGRWWFVAATIFFLTATVIWKLSMTGGPLCNPAWSVFSPSSHVVQGHAIWHMLSACGVFCMYFYFRYQKPVVSCTDFPRLHFAVVEKPAAGNPLDDDPRPLAEGQTVSQLAYKPVKFVDPGVGAYESRPRSMRKHLSSNGSLGTPPVPPNFAEFNPQDGGRHPVNIDGSSG